MSGGIDDSNDSYASDFAYVRLFLMLQRLYKFLLLISPPWLAQPVLSTDGVVYFANCSYAHDISYSITSHIYGHLFLSIPVTGAKIEIL